MDAYSKGNLQANVWKKCLKASPHLSIPIECYWVLEGGNLANQVDARVSCSTSCTGDLACKHVRTCKEGDCPCLDKRLRCTYMCKLQACENQRREEEPEHSNKTCAEMVFVIAMMKTKIFILFLIFYLFDKEIFRNRN